MSRTLVQRRYVEGGYYHIFNRGNHRQEIFHSHKDYEFFINLLQELLGPQKIIRKKQRPNKTYEKTISLIAFCLMSNHIHLLIQQHDIDSMSDFLQSLSLRFTRYRNTTQELVGHTFQDRFKARLIEDDGDLLNTTRYIHRNPKNITTNISQYGYSSAKYFVIPSTKPEWIHNEMIWALFNRGLGITNEQFASSYLAYINM